VSSRQEEKERRRREREERERAEAGKAASKRRLQLVAGGVLALAAIAAVIAAIVSSSGGGNDSKADADLATAAIPARKIADFDKAVAAAGCTYKHYPSEGRTHLSSNTATFNGYKTNPPTSGTHRPVAAEDGVYEPGNPPAKENSTHSLEHGRIDIQYKPGTPKRTQDQLNALFNEKVKGVEGYHTLLFENQTNMPYAVAATAWTQLLGCKTMNPQVFDALRAFRERFVDKGPELIP
jgi:Protein of unknown function (DUF3105)